MKKNRAEKDARYYEKNKEKIAEARKIYLENNKEKTRDTRRKYRDKNREKINEYARNSEKVIKSRKKWHEKNKEQISNYRKEYKNKNLTTIMVKNALYRSKKKGLEHNITADDIIIPEKCPALGIVLERKEQSKSIAFSPSLDRLDPAKGYIKDNINIISMRANTLKSDATFEEFEAIYKWWKSELKKRKKKPWPNTTSE